MGRIEEALAKLQAQRSGVGAVVRRPIGTVLVSDPAIPRQHAYGGKHIAIDLDELRAQGLLAPDDQERKLADEYRAVKRPLLRNANAAREPILPQGNLLMVA